MAAPGIAKDARLFGGKKGAANSFSLHNGAVSVQQWRQYGPVLQ